MVDKERITRRVIFEYIKSAFLYATFFSLIYVLLRYIYIKKRKCEVNICKEIVKVVFIAYITGLLSQTILPLWQCGFVEGKFYMQVCKYGNGSINLIPFKTIGRYILDLGQETNDLQSISKLNLLANIFLFVPYGVFFPLVTSRKSNILSIICAGAFLSVFIEIVQAFIGRSSDVDDFIINVLGVIIGYGVYVSVEKCVKTIKEKRVKSNQERCK